MQSRVKKIQQELVKQKLDALLLRVFESDNKNVLYLSGFSGSTAHLLITRKAAFIIADPRYWLRIPLEVKGFKLLKQNRGVRATELVSEALDAAKIRGKCRLGFESAHVSVDLLSRWKKEIKASFVPTLHLVERFRQYKDPGEIEKLSKACRQTSKVWNEILPLVKPGMTELALAFEIDMRLRKHGALTNSFDTIVAAGANAAVPHHATSSYKLKAGEAVVMDFGGLYPGGYCSDITRTAFVPGKKPAGELVEIYNLVLKANKMAFRAVKPGMMWKEFDAIARDCISEGGYGKYFSHGLGHSLGLVAHDPYDYENDPFQEGTVVTDEPGIYIKGLGGVRIEDDLLVTAGGAKLLTTAPYWRF